MKWINKIDQMWKLLLDYYMWFFLKETSYKKTSLLLLNFHQVMENKFTLKEYSHNKLIDACYQWVEETITGWIYALFVLIMHLNFKFALH